MQDDGAPLPLRHRRPASHSIADRKAEATVHHFARHNILLATSFSCSQKDELMINEGALTLNHDGINREYLLYVPEAYDTTLSYPLLFNFHGFGGNATDHMHSADFRPIADTADFILVYPQGLDLDDGQSHWNIAETGEDNKSNVDDFGFIESLIDEISSEYNINQKKIYACGYSNGAGFSFSIACHLNKSAAIARDICFNFIFIFLIFKLMLN